MTFQERVRGWALSCFDVDTVNDKTERAYRFLEEALELVQALGITKGEALVLLNYTFGRPAGDTLQECGGVMVTLAALCGSVGLDMEREGEAELRRVMQPEVIKRIRQKQQTKPHGSPLPGTSNDGHDLDT